MLPDELVIIISKVLSTQLKAAGGLLVARELGEKVGEYEKK